MPAPRSTLRDVLEALLIALVFATFVRTFVVQAFKIPSASMEENLLVGDHILVNKFVYGPAGSWLERALLPLREPRRGDVIVFKYPEAPRRDFVKRCVGLPGERVEMVEKVLWVDGERVEEAGYTFHRREAYPDSPFVAEPYRRGDNFGPYRVPRGQYFCLGDNRDNSRDSRFWRQPGVPRHYLKGRALLVYWSFAGTPPARPGPGGALGRLRFVARNFLDQTRWRRTFRLVR